MAVGAVWLFFVALVRCAFFIRNLHSGKAIAHAFAPLESAAMCATSDIPLGCSLSYRLAP
jgi:hypothetical protein